MNGRHDQRLSPWLSWLKRHGSILLQVGIGLLVLALVLQLVSNLQLNLMRLGFRISLNWLGDSARFSLSEHVLPYDTRDSYGWVLLVGFVNSLRVVSLGLLVSTALGLIAGAASFSSNLLLRRLTTLYVAVVRNVPLLLQLLFWYTVVFFSLPREPQPLLWGMVSVSSRGLVIFGVPTSVEFAALLTGLSVFTGAYISEVVRGGIASVHRGQWEAARSLGLDEGRTLRLIVIPQALPAILPALNSEYINMAKNSTLAIAVGYPEIYAITSTTVTQTGRAIEAFVLLLLSFLLLDLAISGVMNLLNRLVLKRG